MVNGDILNTSCLPVPLVIAGQSLEIVAHPLGDFEFKGSDIPVSIVNVSLSLLAGRTYPIEQPAGKGSRIREPKEGGLILRSQIPVLKIVQEMKDVYLAVGERIPPMVRKSSLRQMPRRQGSQHWLGRLLTFKENDDIEDRSCNTRGAIRRDGSRGRSSVTWLTRVASLGRANSLPWSKAPISGPDSCTHSVMPTITDHVTDN